MNQTENDALAKQAEACLVSGQLEKAKSLYARLVEIDSNNEEAWLMLAAVLGETGSLDEALRCAQRAIAVDPDYLEAYLTQAHILHRIGRSEEALEIRGTDVSQTFNMPDRRLRYYGNAGISVCVGVDFLTGEPIGEVRLIGAGLVLYQD